MPGLDLIKDETAVPVAEDDRNRPIAALLLVALMVVAFVAIAAGQALAHEPGCGEPSASRAEPVVRLF
jgi:hypothetical protein